MFYPGTPRRVRCYACAGNDTRVRKFKAIAKPTTLSWEDEFALVWGEAPVGSLKHRKGEEVKAFIQKVLAMTEEQIDQELMYMAGVLVANGVDVKGAQYHVKQQKKLLLPISKGKE